MRKKLLAVVAVCLAVLLGAIGAYAYIALNSGEKKFVFEWSSEEQNIVNGTLRIELTFAVKGENLDVLANINNIEHSNDSFCNLLMVFDMNQSGEIEKIEPCFIFYQSNESRSPRTHDAYWDGHGGAIFAYRDAEESPYHTCTFDETGCTFEISIPLEELDLVNDLVIVSFVKTGFGGVWKDFNFGLEVWRLYK